MSLRSAPVSTSARATPPFNPPKRPKATAAGFFRFFFCGGGSVFFNTSAMTLAAIVFTSLLDRLRMSHNHRLFCACQGTQSHFVIDMCNAFPILVMLDQIGRAHV